MHFDPGFVRLRKNSSMVRYNTNGHMIIVGINKSKVILDLFLNKILLIARNKVDNRDLGRSVKM